MTAAQISQWGPRRIRMRKQYIHQPQLACPRLMPLIRCRRPPSVPGELLPAGQWGRPFAIAAVIETRGVVWCEDVNAAGSAVSVSAVKVKVILLR